MTEENNYAASIEKLKTNIHKSVVGQSELVEHLIIALISGGHVLLEGLPGLAKTLSARLFAQSLKLDYSRIQFTPDLMPTDVLGTSIFNFKESDFVMRKGPVFAQILLIDEINRAPAKTQSSLFEIMQERQVTIEGKTYKLEEPFMTIATQNPVDMEGTYSLPEAQLDRFLFKIHVDYPSIEDEQEILRRQYQLDKPLDKVEREPILSQDEILELKKSKYNVNIEESLIQYITKIVSATRSHRNLQRGASPRASLALLQSSRAKAVLSNRDYVIPEDINQLAYPVLRHRIVLNPEAELSDTTEESTIEDVLKSVKVPR